MPEDERTPTAWELLRAVEGVGKSVESVKATMLTRDQFLEYQRGTDRRFETLEKRQAEWEAKSERAHGELHGEIEAAEEAAKVREEKARDSRGRTWLAIAGVVLAVILPRVWDVLRGSGVTP